MQEPFPDEVEVPYGLVTIRLILGLPVWVFAVLLCLGIGPLYLWGWGKWWVSLGCIVLGSGIAVEAALDPQFLLGWVGEMNLKDYYD